MVKFYDLKEKRIICHAPGALSLHMVISDEEADLIIFMRDPISEKYESSTPD